MGTMYILGKHSGAPTRFPLYFREKLEQVVFHTLKPETAKVFATEAEAEVAVKELPTVYRVLPLEVAKTMYHAHLN